MTKKTENRQTNTTQICTKRNTNKMNLKRFQSRYLIIKSSLKSSQTENEERINRERRKEDPKGNVCTTIRTTAECLTTPRQVKSNNKKKEQKEI